jgi:hypothetical protein
MKNKLLLFLSIIFMSNATHANWFADIVHQIEITNGINSQILKDQNGMYLMQRDILSSQRDIQALMQQVNASVTGNSGQGNYNFHDYQSYGDGANNWDAVLQMIKTGGGSGAFGQTVSHMANQFPIDTEAFSRGVSNAETQKYYATQSQTILAARAASQLDYDKVQEQIVYQQMLQQQIEKTTNLKAAMDLNNRLQVESNLISLEILRQTAIANQQQSMSQQAAMMNALSNAKFLTK